MNLKPFLCGLRLAITLSLLLSVAPRAVRADDASEEARQISMLQSQASPQEKDAACVWLKHHGTARSVPELAALLNDDQLSQSARYALETMPGPEAEDALIAALAQTSGPLKAGVVNSLGVRRDARAVPALAKLLTDPDEQVAHATAASLGDIATPAALKALEKQLDAPTGPAQGEVVDGCLRCAQRLLAEGNRKRAFAAYEEIYQRPTKEFYHVAAYRGMVLADGAYGVDLIAKAITNGPASLQMEAIQLVHEKEIPGVTTAIAQLLPNVDPLAQAALIDALGQRDDPAAVPEIAALANQAQPDVRVAAAGYLGNLGDDKNVPWLVEVAATTGDAAQAAARQALTLIHRGNSTQELLDMLSDSKPEAQVEIIRALSGRSAVEAVPQLLRLAQQVDDPVRDAAFQALGRLVDQPQLDALVQVVGQMTTDVGRTTAAGAVVAACRHIQRHHGTVDMTPVWAALKNGPPETRVALFPVCSGLTGPQAKEVLRAGVADSNPQVHAAAARALCDTEDPTLLPDITQLATGESNEELRISAMEACVRLTTQEEGITIPDAERIKLFQALTPAAASAAEKRVVLSGLAALPDERALQLAEPLLSNATVSNEAARAVIAICQRLPASAAAETMLKNISETASDEVRQDAQAALKMVEAREEYITTWEYAGPYRQAGQDFHALFDIAFPPETAGAQGVDWRNLSVSDDPKSPWAMDLLKAMGGEQEVAYARASIHSAAEKTAWLLVNSDDGVKVWLNGTVVHANNVSRSLNGAPDKVKITLQPGWNELLLKVTQNNAGWGFCVRLTDADGSQLKDVKYAAGPAHNQM